MSVSKSLTPTESWPGGRQIQQHTVEIVMKCSCASKHDVWCQDLFARATCRLKGWRSVAWYHIELPWSSMQVSTPVLSKEQLDEQPLSVCENKRVKQDGDGVAKNSLWARWNQGHWVMLALGNLPTSIFTYKKKLPLQLGRFDSIWVDEYLWPKDAHILQVVDSCYMPHQKP